MRNMEEFNFMPFNIPYHMDWRSFFYKKELNKIGKIYVGLNKSITIFTNPFPNKTLEENIMSKLRARCH